MTEDEKKALLEWELILKNICDFVQVGRVNGIRFEVYTNEQGHNRPHLHVSTSDAAMSIAIDTEIFWRAAEKYLRLRRKWPKNGLKRIMI